MVGIGGGGELGSSKVWMHQKITNIDALPEMPWSFMTSSASGTEMMVCMGARKQWTVYFHLWAAVDLRDTWKVQGTNLRAAVTRMIALGNDPEKIEASEYVERNTLW